MIIAWFEKFVRTIMTFFLRLVGKEWNETQWESFLQFADFCLVGLSNTLLSYAINVISLLVLKKADWEWDYVAANLIAFFLSVLWSFYWNNKYVFTAKEGEHRSTFKALMKTYASYAVTGIVLTNILSYVWIEMFGISKYIAPLINLIVSVPLNFILNKLWAFRVD